MSTFSQVRYNPSIVAAGATVPITGDSIGGFLCTTAGDLTVKRYNGAGALVTLFTITLPAVGWYDFPFYLGSNGGQVVSGTAAGILGV